MLTVNFKTDQNLLDSCGLFYCPFVTEIDNTGYIVIVRLRIKQLNRNDSTHITYSMKVFKSKLYVVHPLI